MELDQFNKDRPWDAFAGHKTAETTPAHIRQQSLERMKIFASHYAVHMLVPQTLAYGLQDSPTGLLAGCSNDGGVGRKLKTAILKLFFPKNI